MMDFNSIKKVCINLKRNKARKELCLSEFKKHGIKNFEFFEAIDGKGLMVPELSPKINEHSAPGILGCFLSHLEVIKMAKNKRWESVCILEDDVIFCDDFRERIKVIEELENFDFDIFCLGGHFEKEITSEQAENTRWPNILKVKRMGGTYALIITEKVYDFILRNATYAYGADEFYTLHVYPRFNTYAFVPFPVACRKITSDITDSDWVYENIGWYYQQETMNFAKRTEERKQAEEIAIREIEKDTRPDFSDVTFIVPVKIESVDREFNFMRVIQHLCNTFQRTNIIIKEADIDMKVLHLLKRIEAKGNNIDYMYERCDNDVFHRTRYLNEMLVRVKTPVVVNYDIDVLLKKEAYLAAREKILNDGCDLVYPYGHDMAQVQINFENKQDYQTDLLYNTQYHSVWGSLCGHCQFFRTASYVEGYMENEGFVSYSPEDRERMNRFIRLGYKVEWLNDFQVYHIEHSRGRNSSVSNPFYAQGEGLYERLYQMDKEQIIAYYEGQEYLRKYR